MDLATIVGLLVGGGLVLFGMGSSVSAFIDVPSLLIVAGGTVGAALISFPLSDMIGLTGVIQNAVFVKVKPPTDLVEQLVSFSQKARRDGMLSLESAAKEIDDEYLKKGISLAVDGTQAELVKEILETEMDYVSDRHKAGASILDAMGGYAPAFGMVGTLIGLILMLQSMDDPSSIGPAMAVALITTFYGALMANLIFIPLAAKLKKRSQEERLRKEMIVSGIMSIQSGDNPRLVEQKLNTFLSPKARGTSFE
ncbi:MAG: motility protein A [Candidatus Coatesbacteria bacterium]|nr:motility protein A [Candidatus Coatesbacteria bacterium]